MSTAAKLSETVTFQMPLARRLLSLVAGFFLVAASLFMTVFAVLLLLEREWVIGLLVIAPCACVMAGLTAFLGRDLRGQWGLRVRLEPDALVLDLPVGRSMMRHLAAVHTAIPWGDIAAIETRLEAYPSFGMQTMERGYGLRRKNGEFIYLFEDRALGTPMESAAVAPFAEAIAKRAGVPLDDLGMTEGSGGLAGVLLVRAADWGAPALSKARQAQIWRGVVATGAIPMAVTLLVSMIIAMGG